MVSQKSVCVRFLILVLCITYSSTRKIISEDVTLDESKRRLSDEEIPTASGPLSSTDVWVPELVQENSNEVADEPMSLGYAEVGPVNCPWPACGRPQPRPIPSYFPPNPCQQPYPPAQQAPTYQPPQTEPGCHLGLPPQQQYPPQPQPAPAYPPQVNPGCQYPTVPPGTAPGYQPWPGRPVPPKRPPTEPPFPQPLVDPNCILGCPPGNAETRNAGELDHNKQDGESMNEEEMFSSPPPMGG